MIVNKTALQGETAPMLEVDTWSVLAMELVPVWYFQLSDCAKFKYEDGKKW